MSQRRAEATLNGYGHQHTNGERTMQINHWYSGVESSCSDLGVRGWCNPHVQSYYGGQHHVYRQCRDTLYVCDLFCSNISQCDRLLPFSSLLQPFGTFPKPLST